LLTNAALFSFQRDIGRFRLESFHPGRSAAEIRQMTGFLFDNDHCEVVTPGPDAATLALMRGQIRTELAETYPQFAASLPEAV
jgi:glutaconate CoA-transferase subunit B